MKSNEVSLKKVFVDSSSVKILAESLALKLQKMFDAYIFQECPFDFRRQQRRLAFNSHLWTCE